MQFSPDTPLHSPARLNALRDSPLLDLCSEEPLDRLTALAARSLRAPVALITAVERTRHVLRSGHGVPGPRAEHSEIRLSHALARRVVASGEAEAIADVRRHSLVQDDPDLREASGAAYAGVPLRSEDGRVLGVFSVVDHTPREWTPNEIDALRDLAELAMREATREADSVRSEAVRDLRESEQRYRLVARATHSAIRDWDVCSGECRWEGFSSALLRYTPEEIGSSVQWWYDRIHPEDRERVVHGVRAALDGIGDSWSEEYRFLRGNDEYATVLDCCHIARNERGIPVRVIGSLVDVSERKRAEEAQRFLARASDLLGEELDLDATLASLARLTLPTLGDYCLIDLVESEDGEEALRRVGFAHVDPTKEGLFRKDENHTLDADPERHPVIRAVRSQESVLVTRCTDEMLENLSHDEDHRRKLGEIGLCSFMIVPLLAHGRTVGVITLAAAESGRHYGPRDLLVAENLAHRAALAIDHAQLYSEAHEAVRAREEMMSVVSHDLRNPLNTIHMSAGLLLDAAEERRSENVQSLERIRRASAQMAAMIEDLLDASNIEAGQFSVDPTRGEVATLVQRARDMLQPLCEEKSIGMECVVEDGVPDVRIDSRQIQRVFSNLVGNAIKFTPEGGEITIRAAQRGEEVVLSVSDTGPGIPSDQLPHVFDRYWQARDGDRRGSGLGLAISRGIVEAHGGRIWVESGEGRGTTFHFSIPGDA